MRACRPHQGIEMETEERPVIDYRRVGEALAVVSSLRQAGSWCGETHVQKACYLLSALLDENPGWQFVLYRHGPYSFDLHDDVVTAQAMGWLTQHAQPPYGPSLEVTEDGARLLHGLEEAAGQHKARIDFIARRVGPRNVFELEQLATAVYVKREVVPGVTAADELSRQVRTLKPHVSESAAQRAVSDADQLARDAAALGA
jgi:uncharacterized protein YwgA